jgi:hypothetical protein
VEGVEGCVENIEAGALGCCVFGAAEKIEFDGLEDDKGGVVGIGGCVTVGFKAQPLVVHGVLSFPELGVE